jgi:hypothetical protein
LGLNNALRIIFRPTIATHFPLGTQIDHDSEQLRIGVKGNTCAEIEKNWSGRRRFRHPKRRLLVDIASIRRHPLLF